MNMAAQDKTNTENAEYTEDHRGEILGRNSLRQRQKTIKA